MDAPKQNPGVIEEAFKIESPCSVSWESMIGDDRARKCMNCDRLVFDISNMTKKEAISLAESSTVGLCVRMNVRKDGSVVTRKENDQRAWIFSMLPRWITIAMAVFAGIIVAGCKKQDTQAASPSQKQKSSPTPDGGTWTFIGTVTPRIVIPEEEEERIATPERP